MNAAITMPKVIRVLRNFLLLMVFTSHFLAHGLAQQAGRLDQQHEDQHGEHQRIAQLGGDIRLAENLDHAQQHAADHRARNGADAAEYSRRKRLNAGELRRGVL